MNHRRLFPFAAALVLAVAPLRAALAQYGFVQLATHLSGTPTLAANDPGHGFTALFLKNADGSSTQIYSLQFAPGNYVLSKVEGAYQNCYTEATNVAFTIVSGQWTHVDVPMSFTACQMELVVFSSQGGLGGLQLLVPGPNGPEIAAQCVLVALGNGQITYTDPSACHLTLPWHHQVTLLAVASPGSLTYEGDTVTATVWASDTGAVAEASEVFVGTQPDPPPLPTQHPDLRLTYLGGTYGGQMTTASYELKNISTDLATQVEVDKSLIDSVFGGYDVAQMTSTRGTCSFGGFRCFIHFLIPGESATLTVTVAATENTISGLAPYCTSLLAVQPTLHGIPGYQEIDTTNNRAPCKPANVNVTVSAGGNSPGNQTVAKGSTSVPMLQFTLDPATLQGLDNITLQGQGSGNEQLDVTSVKLYLDRNGNGTVDAGDSVLASGAFTANDGTVTLTLSPAFVISSPTNFLVTYDFSLTLAERLGGEAALALLPLCLVPVMRRRRRWVAAVAVMFAGVAAGALISCSNSSTAPSGASSTYKSTLTGVTISGVSVPGVSLAGATITIQK